MKKIVLTSNNVVIDSSTDADYVKNINDQWVQCSEPEKEMIHLQSKGLFYDASCSVISTEENLPADLVSGRYCIGSDGFYLNPEYIVPEALKAEIIDAYTLQLIEEGLI